MELDWIQWTLGFVVFMSIVVIIGAYTVDDPSDADCPARKTGHWAAVVAVFAFVILMIYNEWEAISSSIF